MAAELYPDGILATRRLEIPEGVDFLRGKIPNYVVRRDRFILEELRKPVVSFVKPASRLNWCSVFKTYLPSATTSSPVRLIPKRALIMSIKACKQAGMSSTERR